MNCPYCGAEVFPAEWVLSPGGSFTESRCGHVILDGKTKDDVAAIFARYHAGEAESVKWHAEFKRRWSHLLKGAKDKTTPFDMPVLS